MRGRVDTFEVAVRTERGRVVHLRSGLQESPLFYAQAVALDWFRPEQMRTNPHVVAIGQCILGNGALTIDCDGRRALFTS